MSDFLHHLFITWFHWVENWGYLGVFLLMAMESSIIPVPSEVVIPPAAFLATQAGSNMSIPGVIIAGTLGSWVGAAITYWISLWIGRAFILKFGGYFMISEKKLAMAEHWVHRYEAGGIFFARLLPVVRHLISIPAGIVRMGFGVFSVMTLIGSAIWCSVLAWYGTKVIQPEMMKNPLELITAVKHQSHFIIGGIAVLCVLYFVVLKLTGKKEAAPRA